MQIRSLPLLLMMVSSAIAVFPVWRSPMISSRCPRPIGIIESMAFRPVAMGSRTGWRSMTPGAIRSSAINFVVLIGPLSSMGCPREFTTRPTSASPTGTLMMRPVRFFVALADLGVISEQHHAALVFFQVHGQSGHPMRKLEQFARHDLVETVHAGNAVAERDHRAHFIDRDFAFVVLDLLADQLRYLVCLDLCHRKSALSC